MVLEIHMKLYVRGLDFLEKNLFLKFGEMDQKQGFEFIEIFGHLFLLNLFDNENFYYLLCSCTNPIFGKIFVPEIWGKMFSASQITGFFS